MKSITFAIAVNDEQVSRANALASPVFHNGHPHEIMIRWNFAAAGLAYNDALALAHNDLMVFMHQDVYLPEHWDKKLLNVVNSLEATGQRWGVLGCFGISLQGEPAGHIFSNGLNLELGGPNPIVPVQSLDEVVLVLRKSSGLRFDGTLPYFYFYGTDICLEAKRNGMENYAISNFCVHNSIPIRKLPAIFWQCAEYLRVKWRHELPVKTCCVTLSPSRRQMWLTRIRYEQAFFRARARTNKQNRLSDPSVLITTRESRYEQSKFEKS